MLRECWIHTACTNKVSNLQVQGKMRTVITALQPEKVQQDQDDNDAAASAFPIMAERSFAREFFHLVLNAGLQSLLENVAGCLHDTSHTFAFLGILSA